MPGAAAGVGCCCVCVCASDGAWYCKGTNMSGLECEQQLQECAQTIDLPITTAVVPAGRQQTEEHLLG
jgi:hypothetical protein